MKHSKVAKKVPFPLLIPHLHFFRLFRENFLFKKSLVTYEYHGNSKSYFF